MKIISFYSFKGGVGRSLSLINLAYQLFRDHGKRVGLLDMDIESCGLSLILNRTVEDGTDLLALLDPRNRDTTRLDEYVHKIEDPKANVSSGIFLLPTLADSARLDKIDWNTATQQFLRHTLIPDFEQLFKLDYLLIDTRIGLSKFSVFPLTIADMQVLVCRLDSQNRYGMKRIVEVCNAIRKPYRIVASACPTAGRAEGLRLFRNETGAEVQYVIPYDPKLYYEELIVSRDNPDHRSAKVYAALSSDICEAVR